MKRRAERRPLRARAAMRADEADVFEALVASERVGDWLAAACGGGAAAARAAAELAAACADSAAYAEEAAAEDAAGALRAAAEATHDASLAASLRAAAHALDDATSRHASDQVRARSVFASGRSAHPRCSDTLHGGMSSGCV